MIIIHRKYEKVNNPLAGTVYETVVYLMPILIQQLSIVNMKNLFTIKRLCYIIEITIKEKDTQNGIEGKNSL